jgi:hypothetical protein
MSVRLSVCLPSLNDSRLSPVCDRPVFIAGLIETVVGDPEDCRRFLPTGVGPRTVSRIHYYIL